MQHEAQEYLQIALDQFDNAEGNLKRAMRRMDSTDRARWTAVMRALRDLRTQAKGAMKWSGLTLDVHQWPYG